MKAKLVKESLNELGGRFDSGSYKTDGGRLMDTHPKEHGHYRMFRVIFHITTHKNNPVKYYTGDYEKVKKHVKKELAKLQKTHPHAYENPKYVYAKIEIPSEWKEETNISLK